MSTSPVRIGTRASRLALWQAEFTAARLREADLSAELVTFSTRGDRELGKPLPELGDKALFTAELDAGLLSGEIDLAVHSLKDLPTELPEGLALSAVPVRASPWDVLVARDPSLRSAGELRQGATVATSSLRRAAQLRAWRPDLEIVSVRGNVPTRVRKVEENGWDGTILAEAGLRRLGMDSHISARFDASVMLPGVSQGALGIVTRESEPSERFQALLNDAKVHRCVLAERAFLRRLEGGCQVPIGALCTESEQGLRLEGVVVSLDGSKAVRDAATGPPDAPEALGVRLAERLLSQGADAILAEIRTEED